MNLIDDTERLSSLADKGEMTRREAARELHRLHDNLTIPGCADLIRNWKDVREHYGQGRKQS